MPFDPVSFALHTPGHLCFPSTRALAREFERAGGRVVVRPTGHLVFYRPDGRRFLAADPSGHPLHECEWRSKEDGTVSLVRARFRLDWGKWVGLIPGGLVNETKLNLAGQSGGPRVAPDDLRAMAARALRVPIEEVRWFYRDEDFDLDGQGMATIRQRKDALYVLDDGTFESARFMACMGAMHWDRIDFLPVVELFKSLLPGTGSAAFELIRGLYDDQNEGKDNPRPLRYRGLPPYPSEAAFRLFSSFFLPQAPSGLDPALIFMDQSRAHEITWIPSADPPVRYFHECPPLCLTVQGERIQKATLADDPVGLSYVNPLGRRFLPWDRAVMGRGGALELIDRRERRVVEVRLPDLQPAPGGSMPEPSPVDWRIVFQTALPSVDPGAVFEAVPLYPQDETAIGEVEAQSFVADYLQDLSEFDRDIVSIIERSERVLVDNGDAVIATCLPFDRPRELIALVRRPAFAIKQAQRLWALCAERQHWEWLRRARFCLGDDAVPAGWRADLAYVWIPYDDFEQPAALFRHRTVLLDRLMPGGNAFVVGPTEYAGYLASAGVQVCWEEAVQRLPTFGMHKTVLPKATLRTGLTLFHVRRELQSHPPSFSSVIR